LGKDGAVRLENRSAVVTGATSGIGRAIALRLAREGAKVTVSDLRASPVWAPEGDVTTVELIERAGGEGHFVAADVSHVDDVRGLVRTAVALSGRLDVVVNNAGIFGSSSISGTSDEEWDHYMAVNLRSQFLMCREVIAQMLTQEPQRGVRGRIVNVSSQLGMAAPRARCAYAVSKAGVAHLTRQLAVDYAKDGIIINAVAPGRIITGTHDGEREYLESGRTDAAIEYSLSRTPFPRLGTPEDVAGAALFLASDDCSFVSGHNLLVDGGWMAY
jgi:glucose 1-dehydrogenase